MCTFDKISTEQVLPGLTGSVSFSATAKLDQNPLYDLPQPFIVVFNRPPNKDHLNTIKAMPMARYSVCASPKPLSLDPKNQSPSSLNGKPHYFQILSLECLAL